MNHHIKKILLVASILALLVSACDSQSLDAVDAAGAPQAEPPPGAQTEPRPTPTPDGDVGDADQVTAFESSQAQIAPSPAEPVSGVVPEGIPSQEERNDMLDRVNLGPPILSGDDGQVGEGPAPGTESVMGPVNDSSSVEPESKTLSVSELLENPIYDTEIRVYGQVSLLGEFSCPCFELISGGKTVVVSYGLMIEDGGTAGPAVSVEGIQNGDQVVVTGELKTAGSHASVNDFWASQIEKAH